MARCLEPASQARIELCFSFAMFGVYIPFTRPYLQRNPCVDAMWSLNVVVLREVLEDTLTIYMKY